MQVAKSLLPQALRHLGAARRAMRPAVPFPWMAATKNMMSSLGTAMGGNVQVVKSLLPQALRHLGAAPHAIPPAMPFSLGGSGKKYDELLGHCHGR